VSAEYADPRHLAERVVHCPRPLLVGLDVDGVLAPIVERADRAALLPGVIEALTALDRHASSISVAVVSGRAVDDLDARYGFPPEVMVVGSHGLETRDGRPLELDDHERHTLEQLTVLAEAAARDAGTGAWVEHKPASSVLHVREVDPEVSDAVVAQLTSLASMVPDAHVKHGHEVVELMARHTSKATAVAQLRRRTGAAGVVFVGDDRTDEEVFATLGPRDMAIRVGPGDTLAPDRLRDPEAVLAWLRALPDALPA
jgi:trehalose 6-phosphate phosphatase